MLAYIISKMISCIVCCTCIYVCYLIILIVCIHVLNKHVTIVSAAAGLIGIASIRLYIMQLVRAKLIQGYIYMYTYPESVLVSYKAF